MGSEFRSLVWDDAMPHLCALVGGEVMCQWGGGHLPYSASVHNPPEPALCFSAMGLPLPLVRPL